MQNLTQKTMWKKLAATLCAFAVLATQTAMAVETPAVDLIADVMITEPTAGFLNPLDGDTIEVSFTALEPVTISTSLVGYPVLDYAMLNVGDTYTYTFDGRIGTDAYLTDGSYELRFYAYNSEGGKTLGVPFNVYSYEPMDILSFTAAPTTWDPNKGDISFDYELSVEGSVNINLYEQSTGINFYNFVTEKGAIDTSGSFVWNGTYGVNNETMIAEGDYRAYMHAYGQGKGQTDEEVFYFTVDYSAVVEPPESEGSDCDDENLSGVIIKELCATPNPWDPSDEELEIEWDIDDDVEEMLLIAREVNGNEEVDLWDEEDVEEDDYDHDWNGFDKDDEYIDEGLWELSLYIRTEDGFEEEIVFTLEVKYEQPTIESDDMFVTKDELDNTIDEFTYLVFRTSQDALVDVEVVDEDGDDVVELWEDEEIEGDKWYTVQWDGTDEDGDEVDEDEDYQFVVTVKNVANDDVEKEYTSEKVLVEEDEVSSSRSNVTNDYIKPVILEKTGDSANITYTIEDDAEVTVKIFKGGKSSSPEVILVDDESKKAGTYTVAWDVRDEDGKKLDKNEKYSYQVTTKTEGSSLTEKERGFFVIGEAGSFDEPTPPKPVNPEYCSEYYRDVTASNPYCEAIAWATDEGIIEGYSENMFKPYDYINRVEALKMSLLAFEVTVLPLDGTTLGFTDANPFGWYMPFLRTGNMLGMVDGYGRSANLLVKPNEEINRVEMLKYVLEAAESVNGYELPVCDTTYYLDADGQGWYGSYVCLAHDYNLYNSYNGNFYPSEDVTRGEVTLLLYRMHKAGLL